MRGGFDNSREAVGLVIAVTGEAVGPGSRPGMGLEDRVVADRFTLSQRTVEGVAQVEESGERGGAAGARGGWAAERITRAS